MKLNALMDNYGARGNAKRVGRGIGSGMGKTSGRGNKGQKARSGISNLIESYGDIEKFIASGKIDAKSPITIDSLMAAKIVNRKKDGLKVLAKGQIKSAVNVVATKWSKAAENAIVKAGGSIKNN